MPTPTVCSQCVQSTTTLRDTPLVGDGDTALILPVLAGDRDRSRPVAAVNAVAV
jgi:hypothetical protein